MTPLPLHQDESPRLRRGGFLFVSLAIHLGAFTLWQGSPFLHIGESDNHNTTTTLHAVLAPAQTEEKVAPSPESVSTTPQRMKKTPESQAAHQVTTATQGDTTPGWQSHQPVEAEQQQAQTEPARKTKTAAASPQADIAKRALGKIRIELARHFRYPRQAVRLGWQGEVLLRFRLSSGGHIEAVQVARSSGYSLLDSAAVRALSDIREIGRVMERHNGTINLQLPVIYRLQES